MITAQTNNICKITLQRAREMWEAREYQMDEAERVERDVCDQYAPCAYSLRFERNDD